MNKSLTLTLILVFLLFTSGMAQTLVINSANESYQLSSHLSVLQDPQMQYSIDDLYQNKTISSFVPLKNWEAPLEANTTYWAKATIKNTLDNKWQYTEWVLHFPLGNSHIDCYVYNQKGEQHFSKTGAFIPYYQKTFAPTFKPNLAKILIPPGETIDIFIKTKSVRPSIKPSFNIQLSLAESYYVQLNSTTRKGALYFGFVMMMFVYNLILYFINKDKAFIYYSFYLTTIACYTAYITGQFTNFFHPLLFSGHPEYVYFGKIFIYVGLISYLTFIRFFLNLKELLPTWDRIFKWLSIIGIPAFSVDFWLIIQSNYSPNVSDFINIPYVILFLILSLIFIFPLYKTKDVKGYFIIGGLSFMGLGILITICLRFQSLEYSSFWFRGGSILEIIVFSLGLAYRQKENEKRKQQAEFELAKSELIQKQEQKEAERLKELDQIKNHLYTNITHEFRTPLTVIMGMSEQLTGNEKEKDLIHRNSKQLYHLINQILDLAKLEDGKLQSQFVQGNIIAYIRYLTESFQSSAESKNIQLDFLTETEEIVMDFDEKGMTHIIQNLITNALKFTPSTGVVTLTTKSILKNNIPFLEIEIKDSGIGINQKDLPHIFDRFYQGTSEITMHQGTGIGLALTKELVEIYNGNISVNSYPNEGSSFVIVLPIQQQAATKIFPLESNVQITPPNQPTNIVLEKVAELDPTDSRPILLIIEDNLDVITYIKSCLTSTYQIQTALNGAEGIDMAQKIIPDIIISDVMMPKKNGFEVVNRLKTDQRTSHIPIILLTAKATQNDKITGLQKGADAYMTKPFNKKELQIRLEKLIELRKKLQIQFQNELHHPFQSNNTPESVFLNTIQSLIEEQMHNSELSIETIGEAMHLSRTQLYRKIKAISGKTPTQFIRSMRMKKALELLKTTHKTVSEIAYQVGFNDPNYFSRTFQKEFGITPSAGRK